MVTIHRCRHVHIAARSDRLQALADGVGEQRVRADFDEGRVVSAGRGDGLAEPHRVAQVGHPVVRIESGSAADGLVMVVLMIGMLGGCGAKSASAVRNSGSIGSMVG